MEFSKKKLLSILKETQEVEFDEMAFRPQNPEMPHRPKYYDPEFAYTDQGERKKVAQKKKGTGEIKIKSVVPGWTKDNPTPPKEEGTPDYWVINATGQPGDEKVWVPIGCNEIEAFVQENKEWIDQLRVKYNIEPIFEKCAKPKTHSKFYDKFNLPKKEEPWTAGERAQRQSGGKREEGFNNLLKTYIINNDKLKEHLELCSIPPVSNTRTNIDRHSEKTNTSFTFRTHHIDYYRDQEEFLKVVVERVIGDSEDKIEREDPTKYIQRQYNKRRTNWEPQRKSDKKFFGYTDVYKMEKKGFKETDIDVMVITNFEIVGTLNNDRFIWNLNFNTKFGNKLRRDERIKKLTEEKNISLQKFADLTDTNFNDRHTIMDDISIKSALHELLSEFVERAMQFSPEEALELANIKGYQVDDADELNEHKIINIINDVIRETKK